MIVSPPYHWLWVGTPVCAQGSRSNVCESGGSWTLGMLVARLAFGRLSLAFDTWWSREHCS